MTTIKSSRMLHNYVPDIEASEEDIPMSPFAATSLVNRLSQLHEQANRSINDLNSKYSMSNSSIRLMIHCPYKRSAFKPQSYDSWSMANKYL